MHRYERKRKADDDGPLKRGQNYGNLVMDTTIFISQEFNFMIFFLMNIARLKTNSDDYLYDDCVVYHNEIVSIHSSTLNNET